MRNVIKTFEKFFNNDVFNIINEKYFSSDFLEINIKSSYGYTVKDDKVIFGCRLTYEPDLSYLFTKWDILFISKIIPGYLKVHMD